MEEFFSSFLRRAGMPASAGLSCKHCIHEIPYRIDWRQWGHERTWELRNANE